MLGHQRKSNQCSIDSFLIGRSVHQQGSPGVFLSPQHSPVLATAKRQSPPRIFKPSSTIHYTHQCSFCLLFSIYQYSQIIVSNEQMKNIKTNHWIHRTYPICNKTTWQQLLAYYPPTPKNELDNASLGHTIGLQGVGWCKQHMAMPQILLIENIVISRKLAAYIWHNPLKYIHL